MTRHAQQRSPGVPCVHSSHACFCIVNVYPLTQHGVSMMSGLDQLQATNCPRCADRDPNEACRLSHTVFFLGELLCGWGPLHAEHVCATRTDEWRQQSLLRSWAGSLVLRRDSACEAASLATDLCTLAIQRLGQASLQLQDTKHIMGLQVCPNLAKLKPSRGVHGVSTGFAAHTTSPPPFPSPPCASWRFRLHLRRTAGPHQLTLTNLERGPSRTLRSAGGLRGCGGGGEDVEPGAHG